MSTEWALIIIYHQYTTLHDNYTHYYYQKEFVMAQRLLQLIITAKESHNLITMIAII